jgi:hypothetical protein
VAAAFALLATGPRPLAVQGRAIGPGLPRRPIPLDELRDLLVHPATRQQCRDEAWRHIVRRARDGQAAWVVGAAGVALPGLRKIARGLTADYGGDTADVDAALLAGFVDAVHRIDLNRPGVFPRLRWAAFRAGLLARYARDGIPPARLPAHESAPPPPPWGHPDLLLADAVAKQVLSPLQAELIGRSRLEGVTLKHAADELGLGHDAAYKSRRRGEARLVAALSSGDVEIRLSNPGANTGLTATRDSTPKPAAGRDRTGRSPASRNAASGRPHQEGGQSGPARRPRRTRPRPGPAHPPRAPKRGPS